MSGQQREEGGADQEKKLNWLRIMDWIQWGGSGPWVDLTELQWCLVIVQGRDGGEGRRQGTMGTGKVLSGGKDVA